MPGVRANNHGLTDVYRGPVIEGTDPRYLRYAVNASAAQFQTAADVLRDILRRMNLPQYHEAAMSPEMVHDLLQRQLVEIGTATAKLEKAILRRGEEVAG